MAQSFDVVVIGAGPGGYVAAIRAAQLGMRVACVEKWRNPAGEHALGGTCLNVGCIPSKALLASSEEFENVSTHLADHGINVSGVKLDVAKMLARKDAVVTKHTKGVEFLFRKNKVTWLKGHGRFVSSEDDAIRIEVSGEGDNESQLVDAQQVIIATGSKARHLPGIPVDNKLVCDNEGALSLTEVPKRLGVIGAGVIGLELGSVWRRLGADVTILEALPEFLPANDGAIRKEAGRLFAKQGLKIHLGAKIGKATVGKKGVKLDWTDDKGAEQVLECDRLIVSIGRVPNTDGLGLDTVGLAVDERGFVPVDDQCRTAVPRI